MARRRTRAVADRPAVRKPKHVADVIDALIAAAKARRQFVAPGMRAPFRFVKATAKAVIVERRNGNNATIPKSKLTAAVEGVGADHRLYDAGPGALRELGISHVNSPIYALIRPCHATSSLE